MSKAAPDTTIDASLDLVADSDIQVACTGQPANFAGIAAVALATAAMAGADFTKADGNTSGRKLTMAAKNGVTVDTSGTATHIALADTGTNTLRYVTTCTSQALVAGNTVNFPTWKIEIADPT
jgi:hypothetical protein